MSEATKTIFDSLQALSKTDGTLAQILAQRKTLEKDLLAKKAALTQSQLDASTRRKKADEKKALCRMEEKNIGEERHQLTERRRVLKDLGTYKLQQAAEREVDGAARSISTREDGLIKMLSDAETLEKDAVTGQARFESAKSEYEKLEIEARETMVNLENRQKQAQDERAAIVAEIEPSVLSVYNRIRDKHAGSAVVPIVNNSCTGCYMQIGPQIVVQISRAQALQRCPGCGRILFIPAEKK